MAAWIQEERGQESWYVPADEDGDDRRPYWGDKERKAYRDSVDTAKQERSLAAQAKQKASDPVKGPCSPSSPTNAKKRRTTSIDKPAIGAPLSSASSSSRASAAADEECLVMSGAELQKVYRSLARADWTVASTRNLMDRMAHSLANEKESINHAKIAIHNILKDMGLPQALLDSDLQ